MFQRNNGPRHFEKTKNKNQMAEVEALEQGCVQGTRHPRTKVTDRGPRDKSEDWQVEGNHEGASGHSHEPSLFARLVATT